MRPTPRSKLNLIAAVANNGIIGADGKLPWDLPEDLRWFREATMTDVLVVGRKTAENLPRLGGRTLVILSTESLRVISPYGSEHTDVNQFHTLDSALKCANRLAAGRSKVWLIGGASLYQQALDADLVDTMAITHVHVVADGDAVFPKFDLTRWDIDPARDLPLQRSLNGIEYSRSHYTRKAT